jgi:hypothetical protein
LLGGCKKQRGGFLKGSFLFLKLPGRMTPTHGKINILQILKSDYPAIYYFAVKNSLSFMPTEFTYTHYYLAILLVVVFLKLFYMLINRIAKNNLVLLANFFLISITFSYLGLSLGILIGASQQPVLAGIIAGVICLIGIFATMLFFNKKYNSDYSKKVFLYFLLLTPFTLLIGADTAAYKRKQAGNSETILQHRTDTEKNHTATGNIEAAVLYEIRYSLQ